MSIKRSASGEIQTLVAALSSPDAIKRESAIARLAILGERAVDRLVAAYATADREARLGILRAAEAIADPRVIPIGITALHAGGDLGLAGAATLRALLDAPADSAAGLALDALIGTALDRRAERHVRVAAFDALRDMPSDVRTRVADALRQDPDAAIRAHATGVPRDPEPRDTAWQDAVDGRLPDDPALLRDALTIHGGRAPFGDLQKLVEAVRSREADATSAGRQEAWRQVRGTIHQALALRGSRVAVYDLRETLETARAPLPTAFMAALHVVGDESCLEPIAAAWALANTGTQADAWRHQLEAAADAIIRRDHISRRGTAWRRLQSRYPEAATALSTISRTRPRPRRSPRT